MSAVGSSSIQELYELPTISGVAAVLHCLESAAFVTPSSHGPLTSPTTEQTEIPDYLTDVRMAESFIKHTNGKVCYWHDAGKWMDFDGKRWETDTPGGAFKYIKGFLAPMYHAALEMPHGSRKAELLKSLLSRESTSGQKNMLDAAAVQPAACITTGLLDRDPWLFNCLNGTVDLKTGILQEHRHDDFMTKIAHVEFDPFAKCPTFNTFISRILGGDPTLISYMKRWIGYCMTGSVAEQVMQIRYGTGANGKSVLSNIEGALLGDYAKAAGCLRFVESHLNLSASRDARGCMRGCMN